MSLSFLPQIGDRKWWEEPWDEVKNTWENDWKPEIENWIWEHTPGKVKEYIKEEIIIPRTKEAAVTFVKDNVALITLGAAILTGTILLIRRR